MCNIIVISKNTTKLIQTFKIIVLTHKYKLFAYMVCGILVNFKDEHNFIKNMNCGKISWKVKVKKI